MSEPLPDFFEHIKAQATDHGFVPGLFSLALVAEVERLQAEVRELTAEPYVIRISRREALELPIEIRRKILERQVEVFLRKEAGE